MPENAVVDLDVAEIAASSLALPRRAEQMLTVLRRLVPFDGAWLALADPHHPRYATAAAADLADSTLTFFTSPQQARDIEATGTDRALPPLSPSDLPFPVEELPGRAECLIPAGYREGLAVALLGPGGRHGGFPATPSFFSVAGRGSPRARRTPAHHRPDPSCGPAGPPRRGGPRVPGRRPERAHPAGARGPGPPGGRPLEPGDRPCPRRHAADRRRSHRAHHGQARDAHAHPGGGTGRTGRPLRTVCAGARPRGGAVKECDPALVRLQVELADVGTMAEGLNQRAKEVLEALGRT